MIDRHARDVAKDALRDLLDGVISNDEYEKRYPEAEGDPAVKAVFWVVWFNYSDMREHKLSGKSAPSESNRDLLERCALFLQSNLEFLWPDPEPRLQNALKKIPG